jgi:hypothetical protein
MGLRPTGFAAERESSMHPITVGVFPVEVEGAVEISMPSGCLMRNVQLNQ